ncbi:MAG: ROK family protein [Clostridia bacterium]|nr:ROK family protein [Clostridia bacterium]
MILALDIGGTAVKLGLVDREGNVLEKTSADVAFDAYRTPIFDTVVSSARRFLKEREVVPEGIAVSATGQVDTDTGVIIGTNGKIPNYEGTRLKDGLEKAFGVRTWALNDANAAVLGECFTGRARGLKNVIMITLGTGVGGGVVADGKILGGRRGIAGEMGHFPLYADGIPCTCGLIGCYENYASVTALIRRCGERTGIPGLNGRMIFERAEAGEKLFCDVLREWIRDIAGGLCGLIHIFNPEMVLIGGGVSSQEELLVRPLRESVLLGTMPRFRENLCLKSAALGNDAGLVGAVRYWLDREVSGDDH